MIKDRLTHEVLYDLYIRKKKNQTEISKEHNCCLATVRALLNRYKIERRTYSDVQKLFNNHNPNVNVEFFKTMSPEFAYILGLWASDGNVHGNSLKLTLNDLDVIEWVAEKIGYKNKIIQYKNSEIISYTLCFKSDEVRDIFMGFGIVPTKSLSLKYPMIPAEVERDYIRGVFDGDGCVMVGMRLGRKGRMRSYQYASFTGASYEFIVGLKEAIERVLGGERKIVSYRDSVAYKYVISAKDDVKKFSEWIYKNNAFGMTRKKIKLQTI